MDLLRPDRIELLHARRQFLHEPVFDGSTPIAVLVILVVVLVLLAR